MMRMSDKGIAFLVAHEGVVPAPYLDSVGVWTFGVGHTASAGPPNPAAMPRGMPADLNGALATAFSIFRKDLERFEARVNQHVKVPLAQHEFDALVSFDFNTGGIFYKNSSGKWVNADLVSKLNSGDRAGAAAAFMNWIKPRSIYDRRKAERDLFRHGQYGDHIAAVWPVGSNNRPIWKAHKTLSQAQVVALARPTSPPERPPAVTTPAVPAAADPVPAFARLSVGCFFLLIVLYAIFGG